MEKERDGRLLGLEKQDMWRMEGMEEFVPRRETQERRDGGDLGSGRTVIEDGRIWA